MTAMTAAIAMTFVVLILFVDFRQPVPDSAAIESRAAESGTGWRKSTKRIRTTKVIAIAAVIAVIGALLLHHFAADGTVGSAGSSGQDPNRIAVLYFEDNSPDHSMGYLANGLTESLIRELSDVPV